MGVLLREAPETSVCSPAFSKAEFWITSLSMSCRVHSKPKLSSTPTFSACSHVIRILHA